MIREHHRRRSPESSHRWTPESSRRRRKDARDSREQLMQSQPIPAPIVRYDERADPTDERTRALSPLSSSSSTSSSLLNISRPSGRFGLGRFFTGNRKQHRVKKKRSRILKFGNSSSSSVNSDLAYGRGYIERRRSRGEFSPPSSSHGRPQMSKRAQTDEEILELGRKFAEIARQQNAEDLRAAGRTRPSALVGAASALSHFRRTNSGNSNRGSGSSKIRRDSSPDDSEWESASDDNDESSGEFDSGLAYGSSHHLAGPAPKSPSPLNTPRPFFSPRSPQSPRSPVPLLSPRQDQPLHRKPSVVDPSLFGPVNSLRGYVEAPCGFEKVDRSTITEPRQPYEPSIPPSEAVSESRPLQRVYPVPTSDPSRFDARGSVVSSQQDLPIRPRPAPVPIQPPPLQQPRPIAPVSRKVLDSVDTDSRYSDRAASKSALGEAAVGGIAGAAVSALLGSSRGDNRDKNENRRDRDRDRDRDLGRDLGRDYDRDREHEGKRRSKRSEAGTQDGRGDKRKSRETLRETREVREVRDIRNERPEKRREKHIEQERESEREKIRQERIAAEAKRESEEKRARDKFQDVVDEYNRLRDQGGKDWVDDWKPKREDGPKKERRDEDLSKRPESQPESYKRLDGPSHASQKGPIDPFQFQVPDDAFQTPLHTTPKRPLTPNVVTVDREPDFSRFELDEDDMHPPERLSRKDSYERELREAQALYRATEHSTAPVSGAAFAAAAAAVIAEDHRGRSRSRGGDASSRNRSRRAESPRRQRDIVQEDANRYYREAELARRIKEDQERRSGANAESVVDKWKRDKEPKIVEIAAPPEMDHPTKKSPYDKPNADVRIDNVLEHPRELVRFQSPEAKGLFQPPVFRARDPSAERERPMLNIVRPTPVPTPKPEEQRPTSASAESSKEVDASTTRDITDVVADSRDEAVQAPPTPKAVSWGENQTKHYVVESPEREDDPYSGAKIVTPAKSPRSRPGRKSAWGIISGAIAGASNGASSSNVPDLSVDTKETETSQRSRDPKKPRHRRSASITQFDDSPPIPGPKPPSPRSVQMPGTFAEDPAFTANIAAALEGSGFDPNIVINDANFHRRESPPSSNESTTYQPPFVESVTDLGIIDAPQNGQDHGFVIGEVETPSDEKDIPTEKSQILSMLNKQERRKQEKAADRDGAEKPEVVIDESRSPETPRSTADNDWDSPSSKISKKERKRREKAAKARALEDEKAANDASRNEQDLEAEFLGAGVDEEDDSSLRKKKSKKSKKAIIVQEDSRQPDVSDSSKVTVPVDAFQDVQDAKAEESTKVTVPVDAFRDVQEAKDAKLEDSRDSPKRSRKGSKRDAEVYDSPSVSTPKPEVFGDRPRKSVASDEFSNPDDEWDISRKSGRRSKRDLESYDSPYRSAPASELSMESSYKVIDTDSVPPTEEEWDAPKKSKKKSKRDSDIFDSPSRSAPASEASLDLTRKATGSDTASLPDAEHELPKRNRWSKRFSVDDEFAAPVIPSPDDSEMPKKSKKKSKRDSAAFDSPSRIEPIAEDIVESPKEISGPFSDWQGDKVFPTEEADTPKKSKKKSKRGSNVYDESPSTPISQSAGLSDVSPTSSKKSRQDAFPDSPSRSTPTTSEIGDDGSRKKSKMKKRRSTAGDFPGEEVNRDESEPPDRGRDPFGILDRDVSSVVSVPTDHRISRLKDDIADDNKSVVSAPGSPDRKDRKSSKSEKDKRSSGNSSFFDRFKSSIGIAEDKERARKSEEDRRNSFLGNADILGAGVGSTSVDDTPFQESRSNATNAPLEEETQTVPFTPERQSTKLLEAEFIDPEIAPREIRPAIDPRYGDLLPLPPSLPGSPVSELGDNYPSLPDSRPESPDHERHLLEMPTHTRRRSTLETPTRPKTPSQSAIPIQFRLGHRHTPSNGKSSPTVSPIVGIPEWGSEHRPRSRPTSWEGSREFKPLLLLQKASRGSIGSIGSPDGTSSPERDASPSTKLQDVWPSDSDIRRNRSRALSRLTQSESPNRNIQLRENIFASPVESLPQESPRESEFSHEVTRSQFSEEASHHKGRKLEESHLPPLPELSTLDSVEDVQSPSPKSVRMEPVPAAPSTDITLPHETRESSDVQITLSPADSPIEKKTQLDDIAEDLPQDETKTALTETLDLPSDELEITPEFEDRGLGQEKETLGSLEVPENDVPISDVSGVRTPASIETFNTAQSIADDKLTSELIPSLEQIEEDDKVQDANLSDGEEMLELSTYLDALPAIQEEGNLSDGEEMLELSTYLDALPHVELEASSSDGALEQGPAAEKTEEPLAVDVSEKDVLLVSEQDADNAKSIEDPLSGPATEIQELPIEEALKEVPATVEEQPEASNAQQTTGTTSKKSKSQVIEPSLDEQPIVPDTRDASLDKAPEQPVEDVTPANDPPVPEIQLPTEETPSVVQESPAHKAKPSTIGKSPMLEPQVPTTSLELATVELEPTAIEKEFAIEPEEVAQPEASKVEPEIPSFESEPTAIENDDASTLVSKAPTFDSELTTVEPEMPASIPEPPARELKPIVVEPVAPKAEAKPVTSKPKAGGWWNVFGGIVTNITGGKGQKETPTGEPGASTIKSETSTTKPEIPSFESEHTAVELDTPQPSKIESETSKSELENLGIPAAQKEGPDFDDAPVLFQSLIESEYVDIEEKPSVVEKGVPSIENEATLVEEQQSFTGKETVPVETEPATLEENKLAPPAPIPDESADLAKKVTRKLRGKKSVSEIVQHLESVIAQGGSKSAEEKDMETREVPPIEPQPSSQDQPEIVTSQEPIDAQPSLPDETLTTPKKSKKKKKGEKAQVVEPELSSQQIPDPEQASQPIPEEPLVASTTQDVEAIPQTEGEGLESSSANLPEVPASREDATHQPELLLEDKSASQSQDIPTENSIEVSEASRENEEVSQEVIAPSEPVEPVPTESKTDSLSEQQPILPPSPGQEEESFEIPKPVLEEAQLPSLDIKPEEPVEVSVVHEDLKTQQEHEGQPTLMEASSEGPIEQESSGSKSLEHTDVDESSLQVDVLGGEHARDQQDPASIDPLETPLSKPESTENLQDKSAVGIQAVGETADLAIVTDDAQPSGSKDIVAEESREMALSPVESVSKKKSKKGKKKRQDTVEVVDTPVTTEAPQEVAPPATTPEDNVADTPVISDVPEKPTEEPIQPADDDAHTEPTSTGKKSKKSKKKRKNSEAAGLIEELETPKTEEPPVESQPDVEPVQEPVVEQVALTGGDVLPKADSSDKKSEDVAEKTPEVVDATALGDEREPSKPEEEVVTTEAGIDAAASGQLETEGTQEAAPAISKKQAKKDKKKKKRGSTQIEPETELATSEVTQDTPQPLEVQTDANNEAPSQIEPTIIDTTSNDAQVNPVQELTEDLSPTSKEIKDDSKEATEVTETLTVALELTTEPVAISDEPEQAKKEDTELISSPTSSKKSKKGKKKRQSVQFTEPPEQVAMEAPVAPDVEFPSSSSDAFFNNDWASTEMAPPPAFHQEPDDHPDAASNSVDDSSKLEREFSQDQPVDPLNQLLHHIESKMQSNTNGNEEDKSMPEDTNVPTITEEPSIQRDTQNTVNAQIDEPKVEVVEETAPADFLGNAEQLVDQPVTTEKEGTEGQITDETVAVQEPVLQDESQVPVLEDQETLPKEPDSVDIPQPLDATEQPMEIQTGVVQPDESALVAPTTVEGEQPTGHTEGITPSDSHPEVSPPAEDAGSAIVEEAPVTTKKTKKDKKKRKSKGQSTLDSTEGVSTPTEELSINVPSSEQAEPQPITQEDQPEPSQIVPDVPITIEPEELISQPEESQPQEPEPQLSQPQESQSQEPQPQEDALQSPVSKRSKKKKKKKGSQVQEAEPSNVPTEEPILEQPASPVRDSSESQNKESSDLPSTEQVEADQPPTEQESSGQTDLPAPEVIEPVADLPEAPTQEVQAPELQLPDTVEVSAQPKDVELEPTVEPIVQVEEPDDKVPIVETESETIPSGDITESRDQKEPSQQATDSTDNAALEQAPIIELPTPSEEVSEAVSTPKSKKNKKKKKRNSQANLDDTTSVPNQEPSHEPTQDTSQDAPEPIQDIHAPVNDVTSPTEVAVPVISEDISTAIPDKASEPVESANTVIEQDVSEPIPENLPETTVDVNDVTEPEPEPKSSEPTPDQPILSTQVEGLEPQTSSGVSKEEAKEECQDNTLAISEDFEKPQESLENLAEDTSTALLDQQAETNVTTPVDTPKDDDISGSVSTEKGKEAELSSIQEVVSQEEPSQISPETADNVEQPEASTSTPQQETKDVDTADVGSTKKSKKSKKKKKASRADDAQPQEEQSQVEPEPATEQITEPITEPVVEPTIESAVEPVAEPVIEPAVEQAVEQAVDLEAEQIAEPDLDKTPESGTQPPETPKTPKDEGVESIPTKKSKKDKKKQRASLQEEAIPQEAILQEEPAQTPSESIDATPAVETTEAEKPGVPESPRDEDTPDVTPSKKSKKSKKKKRASTIEAETEPATPTESEPPIVDQPSELPTGASHDATTAENVILAEEGISTRPSETLGEPASVEETPVVDTKDNVALAEEKLSTTVQPAEVVEEQAAREPLLDYNVHTPEPISTDITTESDINEPIAEVAAEPEVIDDVPEEQSKDTLPVIPEDRESPSPHEPVQPAEKPDDVLQDTISEQQVELQQPEQAHESEESLQSTESVQLEESPKLEDPVQVEEPPRPEEPTQTEEPLIVDPPPKPEERAETEGAQQQGEPAPAEPQSREPLKTDEPVQLEEPIQPKDTEPSEELAVAIQIEETPSFEQTQQVDDFVQPEFSRDEPSGTSESVQLESTPSQKDSQQLEEHVQAEETPRVEDLEKLGEFVQPESTPQIISETQELVQPSDSVQPEVSTLQPSEPEEIAPVKEITTTEEPKHLNEIVEPESLPQQLAETQELAQLDEPLQPQDHATELSKPEEPSLSDIPIPEEPAQMPEPPKVEEHTQLEQPLESEKSLEPEKLAKTEETIEPEEVAQTESISQEPLTPKEPVHVEEPSQPEESLQPPPKPDDAALLESTQLAEPVQLANEPPVVLDEPEIVSPKKSKKDKKKKKKASQAEPEPTPEGSRSTEEPQAQARTLTEEPVEQEAAQDIPVPSESLPVAEDLATAPKDDKVPEDVPSSPVSKKSKKKKKRASKVEPELEPEITPMLEEATVQSSSLEQTQEPQQVDSQPAADDAVPTTDVPILEEVAPEVPTGGESEEKNRTNEVDEKLHPETSIPLEPQEERTPIDESLTQEVVELPSSQPKAEEPVVTIEENPEEAAPKATYSKKSKKEKRKAKQAALAAEAELGQGSQLDTESATPEAAPGHTEQPAEPVTTIAEAESIPAIDKTPEDVEEKDLQPPAVDESTPQLDQGRTIVPVQEHEEKLTEPLDQEQIAIPNVAQEPDMSQTENVVEDSPTDNITSAPTKIVEGSVEDLLQSPSKDIEENDKEIVAIDVPLEPSTEEIADSKLQTESLPDTKQDEVVASEQPIVVEEQLPAEPKDLTELRKLPETSNTEQQEQIPTDQEVESEVVLPKEPEPEPSSPVSRKKSKKNKKKKPGAKPEPEPASGTRTPLNREFSETITSEPMTQEPESIIANEGEWPESPTISKKNQKHRKASGTSTPLESMEDIAHAPSDTIKEENIPENPTPEEILEVEGQSSKSKEIQEQEILSKSAPQDQNTEDVNISHSTKENVAISENDQVTSSALTEDEQLAQNDEVPAIPTTPTIPTSEPVQENPVHVESSMLTSPPRTPITTAPPAIDVDLSPAQLSSHVEHDRPFDQSLQPGKKARTRLSSDATMIPEPLSAQADVPPQIVESSTHEVPEISEPIQITEDHATKTEDNIAAPQDVTPAREIAASYLEAKPFSIGEEYGTAEGNKTTKLIGTSGLLPEITPQREIAVSYFEGYHPIAIPSEDKMLEDKIKEDTFASAFASGRDTPVSHLESQTGQIVPEPVEEKTQSVELEESKLPSHIQDAAPSAREVAADIMESRPKLSKKKETPKDEDLTITEVDPVLSPTKASTPRKGKKGTKQKSLEKRIEDTDDVSDDAALWKSSEGKPLEGARLDAELSDSPIGPSTEVENQNKAPPSDPMDIEPSRNPSVQESVTETVESPIVGREVKRDLPKVRDTGHDNPPLRELPTTEIIEKLDDLDTSERAIESSEPTKEQKVEDDLFKSLSPRPSTQDYLSPGRASPRVLAPVEEETHEELEKEQKSQELDTSDQGSIIIDPNRDSGFVTDSPNPMRRSFVDDLNLRDSGVHLHDTHESTPQKKAALTEEERATVHTPLPNEKRSKKLGLLQSETPKLETPKAPSLEEELRKLTDPKKPRSVGQRSVSENISRGSTPRTEGQPIQPRRSASNTSISRLRTPEPLQFRPESPGSYSRIRSGTNTPPLRRVGKRMSGDLRSLSSNLSNDSNGNPSRENLHQPSTTPVANEGRVRAKDMTDVYDGYGEGRIGSPRSPTRPLSSMRRRQSMQVLELESRVEQLVAENRALTDAKSQAERNLNQHAVSAITERDAEIESLKASLEWLRKEVTRLTEVNEGLHSANNVLALQHNEKYGRLESQHASASKELEEHRFARGQYTKTLQEKDAEIQELRAQLEATKEQVREMQRQILAQKPPDADFLRLKDEDHFDHRCQQLCSHVQQWVLRFSKFSDMRACRLTSEINDEKIIDRLDNSVLDGSDVDDYLSDRVRRRDIFMSMTMNMIWEFVFTRYLFGMDREQRQKLKSLEKLLQDVGPPHAVRQWRAVTLTLLSRRPAFGDQRNQDTEAVVQAVFQTLSMILPPPSNMESQIQSQLRRVMREAVDLSVEMRTQKAEYMMLPPLQPEYDADGELARTVSFNAALMNERSGDNISNDEYEAQGAVVRTVLFPLVVKKGDDNGVGDEEIVICPAQVLVAKPPRHATVRMVTPSSEAGGVPLSRGATPSVSARGAQSTVSLQMTDAPLPIPTPPHEDQYR